MTVILVARLESYNRVLTARTNFAEFLIEVRANIQVRHM